MLILPNTAILSVSFWEKKSNSKIYRLFQFRNLLPFQKLYLLFPLLLDKQKANIPKPVAKKSAPKKVAKKPKKSKYYISEDTFDKISKDFYRYFKKEFDWRTSVEYIEVHIENMFRIREVWFYLTFVFRGDLSKEEMGFVKDQLMSSDYGYANRDIKNGNLEKVSSDLVLGFFDPELLQTLDENDIKIMAPLYMKGNKSKLNMYELEPGTYLSPTLNDDT